MLSTQAFPSPGRGHILNIDPVRDDELISDEDGYVVKSDQFELVVIQPGVASLSLSQPPKRSISSQKKEPTPPPLPPRCPHVMCHHSNDRRSVNGTPFSQRPTPIKAIEDISALQPCFAPTDIAASARASSKNPTPVPKPRRWVPTVRAQKRGPSGTPIVPHPQPSPQPSVSTHPRVRSPSAQLLQDTTASRARKKSTIDPSHPPPCNGCGDCAQCAARDAAQSTASSRSQSRSASPGGCPTQTGPGTTSSLRAPAAAAAVAGVDSGFCAGDAGLGRSDTPDHVRALIGVSDSGSDRGRHAAQHTAPLAAVSLGSSRVVLSNPHSGTETTVDMAEPSWGAARHPNRPHLSPSGGSSEGGSSVSPDHEAHVPSGGSGFVIELLHANPATAPPPGLIASPWQQDGRDGQTSPARREGHTAPTTAPTTAHTIPPASPPFAGVGMGTTYSLAGASNGGWHGLASPHITHPEEWFLRDVAPAAVEARERAEAADVAARRAENVARYREDMRRMREWEEAEAARARARERDGSRSRLHRILHPSQWLRRRASHSPQGRHAAHRPPHAHARHDPFDPNHPRYNNGAQPHPRSVHTHEPPLIISPPLPAPGRDGNRGRPSRPYAECTVPAGGAAHVHVTHVSPWTHHRVIGSAHAIPASAPPDHNAGTQPSSSRREWAVPGLADAGVARPRPRSAPSRGAHGVYANAHGVFAHANAGYVAPVNIATVDPTAEPVASIDPPNAAAGDIAEYSTSPNAGMLDFRRVAAEHVGPGAEAGSDRRYGSESSSEDVRVHASVSAVSQTVDGGTSIRSPAESAHVPPGGLTVSHLSEAASAVAPPSHRVLPLSLSPHRHDDDPAPFMPRDQREGVRVVATPLALSPPRPGTEGPPCSQSGSDRAPSPVCTDPGRDSCGITYPALAHPAAAMWRSLSGNPSDIGVSPHDRHAARDSRGLGSDDASPIPPPPRLRPHPGGDAAPPSLASSGAPPGHRSGTSRQYRPSAVSLNDSVGSSGRAGPARGPAPSGARPSSATADPVVAARRQQPPHQNASLDNTADAARAMTSTRSDRSYVASHASLAARLGFASSVVQSSAHSAHSPHEHLPSRATPWQNPHPPRPASGSDHRGRTASADVMSSNPRPRAPSDLDRGGAAAPSAPSAAPRIAVLLQEPPARAPPAAPVATRGDVNLSALPQPRGAGGHHAGSATLSDLDRATARPRGVYVIEGVPYAAPPHRHVHRRPQSAQPAPANGAPQAPLAHGRPPQSPPRGRADWRPQGDSRGRSKPGGQSPHNRVVAHANGVDLFFDQGWPDGGQRGRLSSPVAPNTGAARGSTSLPHNYEYVASLPNAVSPISNGALRPHAHLRSSSGNGHQRNQRTGSPASGNASPRRNPVAESPRSSSMRPPVHSPSRSRVLAQRIFGR